MEFHVIGEIVGASGFGKKRLFCKWGIVHGPCWELLEGVNQGQTNVDRPRKGDSILWSHPIDVHYLSKGLIGWPKIHFQIWSLNTNQQLDLCGYGFCHIPSLQGMTEIECETWLPEGTFVDRIRRALLGRGVELRNEHVIHEAQDRYRLRTLSSGGKITLRFAHRSSS